MSIDVKIDNEVGKVLLNYPEQGNRLTQESVIELGRGLWSLAADKSLKAVLISAAGDNFCMGRIGGQRSGSPTALQLRSAMMGPIIEVYRAMRAIEGPVVSTVQGEANGFGAALAVSCDITLAAENARFSFPEMKVDMPPTLAMATVIDRIALKRLAWMVYTTESIDATQALEAGLVSHVVPVAELSKTGEETLKSLTARKRDALRGVKQYLANARLREFEQAADYGANLLAVTLSSQQ
jgi:enoyl-CoA hydratase